MSFEKQLEKKELNGILEKDCPIKIKYTDFLKYNKNLVYLRDNVLDFQLNVQKNSVFEKNLLMNFSIENEFNIAEIRPTLRIGAPNNFTEVHLDTLTNTWYCQLILKGHKKFILLNDNYDIKPEEILENDFVEKYGATIVDCTKGQGKIIFNKLIFIGVIFSQKLYHCVLHIEASISVGFYHIESKEQLKHDGLSKIWKLEVKMLQNMMVNQNKRKIGKTN